MKKHIKIKAALILTVLISLSLADAKPLVEKEVKDFLDNPHQFDADEKFDVVVTFNGTSNTRELEHTAANHAAVEKMLIQQNLERIKGLGLGSNNKTVNLWLAQAAQVSLGRQEIRKLGENKSVTSLLWAKKKLMLKVLPAEPTNLFSSVFTYGLTLINIPKLREKYPNLTGDGVRVGALDTGLTPNHPDLIGRLLLFKNFSPEKNDEPSDGYNHGTHVSGTMVGGEASGTAIGVAPKAQLIMAKIFGSDGSSSREGILNAMQWVADPDGNPKTDDFAQVVNNSWGNASPFNDRDPDEDSYCNSVNNWVKLGIVPVFSAGNSGQREGSVGLPAGCPNSFSVAAVDSNDNAAEFSSMGPAKWKSKEIMKPEISAPGVAVVSSTNDLAYAPLSGTSMAAPHVTGAIALLLQANPKLSVEKAEALIEKGAKPLGAQGQNNTYGYGRLDIFNSVELLKAE